MITYLIVYLAQHKRIQGGGYIPGTGICRSGLILVWNCFGTNLDRLRFQSQPRQSSHNLLWCQTGCNCFCHRLESQSIATKICYVAQQSQPCYFGITVIQIRLNAESAVKTQLDVRWVTVIFNSVPANNYSRQTQQHFQPSQTLLIFFTNFYFLHFWNVDQISPCERPAGHCSRAAITPTLLKTHISGGKATSQ